MREGTLYTYTNKTQVKNLPKIPSENQTSIPTGKPHFHLPTGEHYFQLPSGNYNFYPQVRNKFTDSQVGSKTKGFVSRIIKRTCKSTSSPRCEPTKTYYGTAVQQFNSFHVHSSDWHVSKGYYFLLWVLYVWRVIFIRRINNFRFDTTDY